MADTLESLEIQVKHSASGAADEINKVADAVKNLSTSLKGVPAKMEKLVAAMNSVKGNMVLTVNSSSTTQTAETINNIQQAASKAGKATQEASKGVKELHKQASKSKGPLDNLISSLKRIAFYRIIRSIIKAITQALQEGLQNAYAFSQGINTEGHRFSSALDSMSSAGLKMKNQLGSAFIALLAAIAPIVNSIISLITRLADALSQFFSIFTGGTYLKAVDVPAKWADGAAGAAKATKEWKNQLLGFDEINRLDAPSDNGGSGGSGGELDPSAMFVDTPIDGIFAKIREKWLELKNELDFEPLKKAWGELKDALAQFVSFVEDRFGFVWETYLKPFAHWTIEEGLPLVIGAVAKAIELISTVLEKIEPYSESFETYFLVPLANWEYERVTSGLHGVYDALKLLVDLLNGDVSFDVFAVNFGEAMRKIIEWVNPVLKIGRELGEFFGEEIRVIFEVTAETLSEIWDGIKKAWNDLWDWLKGKWNELETWWKTRVLPKWDIKVPKIEIEWTEAGELAQFFGVSRVPKLHIVWDSFATGGFPEDGLFMANHSELVGKFSNGRTAVANNEQIIEGIKQGVIEALLTAGNSDNGSAHNVIIDINGREFFRATYNDQKAVAKERGISLIANG